MFFKSLTFKSQASFKRQLISFFVASVCILAITTSIITAWQTSEQLKKSTIETGLQLTNNFSEQSLLALLTASKENGQEAVDRALGFKSVVGVAVFKIDGELLIGSTKNKQSIHDFIPLTSLNSAMLQQEQTDTWTFVAPVFFIDDVYDIDMAEPIDDSNKTKKLIGFVIVEYGKDELHKIQNTIFINNIVIGAIVSLLLALIMSFGINRLILPLTELSQVMESARNSSIYPRAQVTGAADIRKMAEVYNQMMTHLEEQNFQMEKHKNTLESEVEIRTLELKAARDTALTANRHKSEFLANISHELRTPLQAIIGYTDLVKEELELENMQPQVEDLNKSTRAANNLLALINNILDLAKVEAGRMDLYLRATDTEYLINDTVETVLPMATANNNKLIVEKGELATSLVLDRQKMMQIFLNLLSNACKFTKDGEIIFSIYNDQHFLYFSVKDTGVGIPQDKLDFIFEQFTQVDGSQTRKFEGTGLGMAITKTFCELMDGKMKVESEVNVGTKFSVKLPLQR